MTAVLFVLCLVGIAGYLVTSGFHDAQNSVAVPVRTRALTPTAALRVCAAFNFIGVLTSGIFLAGYVRDWLALPAGGVGLAILAMALLAQVGWSLMTWYLRMPSSSTHAVIGGLLGAAWAARAVGFSVPSPFTQSVNEFVLVPLLLVPLLIFVLAWALVFPLSSIAQNSYPRTVNRVSRHVMSVANSTISLFHGVQTGQRVFLFLTLALLGAGIAPHPMWDVLGIVVGALLLTFGTMLGGWRIGYTFAHRMVRVDPFRGAVAQGTTAFVFILTQFFLNASISTSHIASTAVLGAGVNQRFSSVRGSVVAKVLLTWIATVPMCFGVAAVLFLAISPLLGA
ncbi:inorganic phosphate transporter [Rothia sp. LK2588]|uniref:anion permease n=1 Tax=Rothia sp. LK2588 TaxID=3114369 RepID=UPI0034CFC6C8